MPREVIDALSLDVLEARLDGALSKLTDGQDKGKWYLTKKWDI